jgi:hypothetical protein
VSALGFKKADSGLQEHRRVTPAEDLADFACASFSLHVFRYYKT